jgi:hypothetical protein
MRSRPGGLRAWRLGTRLYRIAPEALEEYANARL